MAGLMRGLLKSAVAAKALKIAQREMAKPENQRKARELLGRATQRRRPRP